MKHFRVFLRGENFLLNLDGAVKRYGFYTTRFVDALDEVEAERRAVELLRQAERLQGGVLNDSSDPPMLFAEEIEETKSVESVETRLPGLAFYEDKPTAQ